MTPPRITKDQLAALQGGTVKPKKKRRKGREFQETDQTGYDPSWITSHIRCPRCGFCGSGKAKHYGDARLDAAAKLAKHEEEEHGKA